MRYPEFLKENGTIGLVAPSCGAGFEPYISTQKAAIEYFKNLGYKIQEGPNIWKGEGIGISSSPENCGSELTDFYCSKDNDILISCGGGELMCETVDFIDFYEVMKAEPKWYMGFSDNTNFTFLLNTICDVASIYGPCVGSFGARALHQSHQDAIDVLTGKKMTVSGYDEFELLSLKTEEDPYASYNLDSKKELKLYMGAEKVDSIPDFSGRIIGGCCDVLANLCGTKYDHVAAFNDEYSEDGIVWFLECCDYNVMTIRRALWNLDRAGWFENAKGFIFGRPCAAYGEESWGITALEAVTAILGKYNVPIIQDADIGHLNPSMPIISGAYANVSVANGNITVKHELI